MKRWLNQTQVYLILKEHVGEDEAIAFKRQMIPLVRYSFVSPWEMLWWDPGSYAIRADSGRVKFVAAVSAWVAI